MGAMGSSLRPCLLGARDASAIVISATETFSLSSGNELASSRN